MLIRGNIASIQFICSNDSLIRRETTELLAMLDFIQAQYGFINSDASLDLFCPVSPSGGG